MVSAALCSAGVGAPLTSAAAACRCRYPQPAAPPVTAAGPEGGQCGRPELCAAVASTPPPLRTACSAGACLVAWALATRWQRIGCPCPSQAGAGLSAINAIERDAKCRGRRAAGSPARLPHLMGRSAHRVGPWGRDRGPAAGANPTATPWHPALGPVAMQMCIPSMQHACMGRDCLNPALDPLPATPPFQPTLLRITRPYTAYAGLNQMETESFIP